jgi:hypothetical protein
MSMSADMRVGLKKLMLSHSPQKNLASVDSSGVITAGIGHNLSTAKISQPVIDGWFNEDVDYLFSKLTSDYKWFASLDVPRQTALIDLASVGYLQFSSMTQLLSDMAKQDYKAASVDVTNLPNAAALGQRAKDDSAILLSGKLS